MALTRGRFPFDMNFAQRHSEPFVYDFAESGGAQGNIVLGQLPDNASVIEAFYEVITPFTSGGLATVAVGIETDDATGIVGTTAFDNAIFSAGFHDATPDRVSANFTTKTTDTRDIVLTIADADLTAGKVYFWMTYVVSE